MARVVVTGNLWDHMGEPIPATKRPELLFRPVQSSVVGNALLAGVEARASLNASTGAFTVGLEANPGVEYRMVARWVMDETQPLERWAYQYAEWPRLLHPYPAGGRIEDLLPLGPGSPLSVLVSLEDPPRGYRGLWLHAAPGDPTDFNQSGSGELRRVVG